MALRFPVSFQIAVMSGIIAMLIAIPLGTISALYRDTWIDHSVRVLAVSGLAIPSFWLGMLIILALISIFGWLPKIGYVPFWQDPIANLSVTIWPAISVGYRYAAGRHAHDAFLAARGDARGLHPHGPRQGRVDPAHHAPARAAQCHAARGDRIGLEFAFLIGGLVVTEQVFNINGIGKLFVDATARGDFNLIQGLVLLIATIFIFVNLLVDLLYGWLDPRIRLTWGRHAMATVAATPSAQADALPKRPSPVLQFVKSEPLGLFGLLIIVVYAACAFGAEWIAPFDPEAIDFGAMLSRPGARALVRHRPVRPRRVLAASSTARARRWPWACSPPSWAARWARCWAPPRATSAAASTTPSSAWSTSCCRFR